MTPPPSYKSDDSEVGGGTGGGPAAANSYVVELVIHEDDFAVLANSDALVTLNNAVSFTGITGTYYVTLSKQVPVLPAP